MDRDRDLREAIARMVEEEHVLRSHTAEAGSQEERTRRLASIEVELDQCWDLLRQREALRRVGADPGEAHVRPPSQVENYLG